MRYLTLLFSFILVSFLVTPDVTAQCNNWSVAIVNVQPSECIANGSFSVQLSGSDLANLSNIKYSIPLTQSGFSVQPNTSPDFANIPAGTFTVKVDANCGGGSVSKTTTVTVGGNYVSPGLLAAQWRGSLSCGSYGQISVAMSGSSYPYTLKIVSYPVSYTGPTVFTTSATGKLLDHLPAGNYTLQVIDTCGTATPTQTVTVASINPSVLFNPGGYSKSGNACNKVNIFNPYISFSTNPSLAGYFMADTLFEVALSIDGGATVTPFKKIDNMPFHVNFPAGKTIKDMAGSNYIFYVKPPCGPVFQVTGIFGSANLSVNTSVSCNAGFTAYLQLSGFVCYPVTFYLKDINTSINYGPYVANNGAVTTALLPYGSYSLTYATADGYQGNGAVYASAPSANPYNVSTFTEAEGLNGYISEFHFSYVGGSFPNGAEVKLVSGPPGYAFTGTSWGAGSWYTVSNNGAPVISSNNLYFIPGSYTWQVKDACGTYILPIQVPQSNVYQYTLDLSNRQQTCNGLKVYPSGTRNFGGSTSSNVIFAILQGPGGPSITPIHPGDFFLLSQPGTYVIGVSASTNFVFSYGSFPNAYQVLDTIVYDHQPLTVDVNNTQGFLCIGASAGQGQIGIKGLGGMPFKFPSPHYQYYLAAAGQGTTGPYISSNTTGFFAGMNMNANDVYDLKIVDSCGAFVTHQVKILDLANTQLAGAVDNDICVGDSLLLYALPLPGGSYSWTGPNGFSSNLQKPVILNAGISAAGQYTVTITTPYCTTPASSSIQVDVHPAPAKASVSVNCIDTTAVLTASAVASADYEWYKNGSLIAGQTGKVFTVTEEGNYFARTVFPVTGCYTSSDTIAFTAKPGIIDTAAVTAPKDFLCGDDSVLLTAQTKYASVNYQWYKNGIAIPGATQAAYYASSMGLYIVKTSTGPCASPLSLPLAVQDRKVPASIKAITDTIVCEKEPVILTGNSGVGLTYIWKENGNIIAGATGTTLFPTHSGQYSLEVSNGYCIRLTRAVNVTVNERPVAELDPADDASICRGKELELKAKEGTGYYYQWKKDGVMLTGATGSAYIATLPGRYTVVTGNGKCPDDSAAVNVSVIDYPSAKIAVEGPVAFCEGLTTVLKTAEQPGCTYDWYRDGQLFLPSNVLEQVILNSGKYQVSVSRKACATLSDAVEITVFPKPAPVITRKDQQLFTGLYTNYQWYNNGLALMGKTHQSLQLPEPGYYTVVVTDTNGCTGTSDTLRVVSVEEGCIVRLPSAFSPNNDGLNDVFRPVGLADYELLELRIVNRWGQVVFDAPGSRDGWDGTLNGSPQETGSYFYILRYRCNDETAPRSKKGEVSLIR